MEKDTTYSSLWLFRKTKMPNSLKDPIANIKNFRQAGNKYYSEFNPQVATNIINYWSNEGDSILDPFAGRTRAIVSSLKNRRYSGFEVSKEVYDKMMKIFIDNNLDNIELFNEDSFNMDKYSFDEFDLLFTCPPYWNIEKYESCLGQLSDLKDYDKFLQRLKEIMFKSIKHLRCGGYAAMVIGDFRKNGKYYPFHSDVINFMKEKAKLHDVIVIQSVTFDIANRRFGSFKNAKITSKVHEYLLIFKK